MSKKLTPDEAARAGFEKKQKLIQEKAAAAKKKAPKPVGRKKK